MYDDLTAVTTIHMHCTGLKGLLQYVRPHTGRLILQVHEGMHILVKQYSQVITASIVENKIYHTVHQLPTQLV